MKNDYVTKEYFDQALEKFAQIIFRGCALKEDLKNLATKDDVRQAEERLTQRIDKIEYNLLRAHENRLDKVEDNIRIVKTKLGLA